MKSDLTIVYATACKIPAKFADNILAQLHKAAGDYPIKMAIDKPSESSITNYYRSLLEIAKQIKTPYLAIAEDDTLYPPEHFTTYRPPLDTFAYNFNRWNIHTWQDPPFYSLRQRKILATLIAPRELFIEAVEERLAKHPSSKVSLEWFGEPGRQYYERKFGITERKSTTFATYVPVLVFSHEQSFGFETTGKNKRAGKIRALEIPLWCRASDIIKLYKE